MRKSLSRKAIGTMENNTINPEMKVFVFYRDHLLLKKQTGTAPCRIPTGRELPWPPPPGQRVHNVALPNGETIQTFEAAAPLPEDGTWMTAGLRASFDHILRGDYRAAGKAYQILYWDKHSHFCPVCGSPTEQQTSIMKRCLRCGNELYPPISTAIIVLIRREKEILLVHARNFRGTFYGLVAGFLEPGETLEQCVKREVWEETGLHIKNITYFGSQPWPYPSGLMVGFVADYDSGEIKLQADELSAGAFYDSAHLPELPQKLSIARRLIDWWLNTNINNNAS